MGIDTSQISRHPQQSHILSQNSSRHRIHFGQHSNPLMTNYSTDGSFELNDQSLTILTKQQIVQDNYQQQYDPLFTTFRPQNKQIYGKFKILCSKITNQKIHQYRLVFKNEQQLKTYLMSYYWRKSLNNENQFPLVRTVHFKISQQSKKMLRGGIGGFLVKNCSGRKQIMSRVYVQDIPLRLCHIKDIPFPQNLYVLKQVLRGFHIIYDNIGYIKPFEDLICINRRGYVKVWINSDLSKNFPNIEYMQSNFTTINSQSKLINEIVQLINANTDSQGQPIPLIIFMKQCHVSMQYITFEKIFEMLARYCLQYQIQLPQVFSSIVQVLNEQQQQYDTYRTQMQLQQLQSSSAINNNENNRSISSRNNSGLFLDVINNNNNNNNNSSRHIHKSRYQQNSSNRTNDNINKKKKHSKLSNFNINNNNQNLQQQQQYQSNSKYINNNIINNTSKIIKHSRKPSNNSNKNKSKLLKTNKTQSLRQNQSNNLQSVQSSLVNGKNKSNIILSQSMPISRNLNPQSSSNQVNAESLSMVEESNRVNSNGIDNNDNNQNIVSNSMNRNSNNNSRSYLNHRHHESHLNLTPQVMQASNSYHHQQRQQYQQQKQSSQQYYHNNNINFNNNTNNNKNYIHLHNYNESTFIPLQQQTPKILSTNQLPDYYNNPQHNNQYLRNKKTYSNLWQRRNNINQQQQQQLQDQLLLQQQSQVNDINYINAVSATRQQFQQMVRIDKYLQQQVIEEQYQKDKLQSMSQSQCQYTYQQNSGKYQGNINYNNSNNDRVGYISSKNYNDKMYQHNMVDERGVSNRQLVAQKQQYYVNANANYSSQIPRPPRLVQQRHKKMSSGLQDKSHHHYKNVSGSTGQKYHQQQQHYQHQQHDKDQYQQQQQQQYSMLPDLKQQSNQLLYLNKYNESMRGNNNNNNNFNSYSTEKQQQQVLYYNNNTNYSAPIYYNNNNNYNSNNNNKNYNNSIKNQQLPPPLTTQPIVNNNNNIIFNQSHKVIPNESYRHSAPSQVLINNSQQSIPMNSNSNNNSLTNKQQLSYIIPQQQPHILSAKYINQSVTYIPNNTHFNYSQRYYVYQQQNNLSQFHNHCHNTINYQRFLQQQQQDNVVSDSNNNINNINNNNNNNRMMSSMNSPIRPKVTFTINSPQVLSSTSNPNQTISSQQSIFNPTTLQYSQKVYYQPQRIVRLQPHLTVSNAVCQSSDRKNNIYIQPYNNKLNVNNNFRRLARRANTVKSNYMNSQGIEYSSRKYYQLGENQSMQSKPSVVQYSLLRNPQLFNTNNLNNNNNINLNNNSNINMIQNSNNMIQNNNNNLNSNNNTNQNNTNNNNVNNNNNNNNKLYHHLHHNLLIQQRSEQNSLQKLPNQKQILSLSLASPNNKLSLLNQLQLQLQQQEYVSQKHVIDNNVDRRSQFKRRQQYYHQQVGQQNKGYQKQYSQQYSSGQQYFIKNNNNHQPQVQSYYYNNRRQQQQQMLTIPQQAMNQTINNSRSILITNNIMQNNNINNNIDNNNINNINNNINNDNRQIEGYCEQSVNLVTYHRHQCSDSISKQLLCQMYQENNNDQINQIKQGFINQMLQRQQCQQISQQQQLNKLNQQLLNQKQSQQLLNYKQQQQQQRQSRTLCVFNQSSQQQQYQKQQKNNKLIQNVSNQQNNYYPKQQTNNINHYNNNNNNNYQLKQNTNNYNNNYQNNSNNNNNNNDNDNNSNNNNNNNENNTIINKVNFNLNANSLYIDDNLPRLSQQQYLNGNNNNIKQPNNHLHEGQQQQLNNTNNKSYNLFDNNQHLRVIVRQSFQSVQSQQIPYHYQHTFSSNKQLYQHNNNNQQTNNNNNNNISYHNISDNNILLNQQNQQHQHMLKLIATKSIQGSYVEVQGQHKGNYRFVQSIQQNRPNSTYQFQMDDVLQNGQDFIVNNNNNQQQIQGNVNNVNTKNIMNNRIYNQQNKTLMIMNNNNNRFSGIHTPSYQIDIKASHSPTQSQNQSPRLNKLSKKPITNRTMFLNNQNQLTSQFVDPSSQIQSQVDYTYNSYDKWKDKSKIGPSRFLQRGENSNKNNNNNNNNNSREQVDGIVQNNNQQNQQQQFTKKHNHMPSNYYPQRHSNHRKLVKSSIQGMNNILTNHQFYYFNTDKKNQTNKLKDSRNYYFQFPVQQQPIIRNNSLTKFIRLANQYQQDQIDQEILNDLRAQ